jgi:PAS domain S-box-containing protein
VSDDQLDKKFESWFQISIDHIPDGVLILSEEGVVQAANTAASKMLGTSVQSMIDRPARVLLGTSFHPRQYVGKVKPAPLDASTAGLPSNLTLAVDEFDGEAGSNYFVTMKVLGTARTDQGHARELAFLADQIHAFVLSFHPETGITWCNTQTETLTGYQCEYYLGKPLIGTLIEGKGADLIVDLISEAVERLQPFRTDALVRHFSGQPFWARIEAHPLMNEDGELEKYIVTGTDITDERQQRQIQNNFCSMVSHELRTPLTVVSGALDALQAVCNNTISDDANELILMGQRNCTHLSALIEDVLEINHLESGEIPMSLEGVDVVECIRGTMDAMHALFESTGHHLQLLAAPEKMTAIADKTRIRQILTNLLSNARKFSNPGSTTVVSVSVVKSIIQIEVCDQGLGIPIAFQPALFDRFSRDSEVRANGIEGFGLGLSITKKLVEQMHGQISFESAEGIGTTFRIELPAY